MEFLRSLLRRHIAGKLVTGWWRREISTIIQATIFHPRNKPVLQQHVTQVKAFGVPISSDLTWDTHINTILAKANRMFPFLRHNSVMLFTTDHRKLLYLTFIRSYIGYASEVWAPSMGS